MNKKGIKVSVILGILAISAIISFQYLWLKEAFDTEKREFNQTVHIALLEVAKLLVKDNHNQLPHINPVQKVADNYYLVRIDDEIHADILEFYLKSEFEKLNIHSDFEYAIYNCETDEMVYGDYISLNDKNNPIKKSSLFPKIDGLVYYFAVRFPNQLNFISGPTRLWSIITIISIVVLAIYIYSLFVIMRQNRYYELQKDFINNMTHEFKTPLSSIMIASDYLSSNPTIKNDERLSKYSSAISNQSSRLNQHVEKILNLARSEKASFRLEKKEIDLISILNHVSENFQIKYHNKVKLDMHCPDESVKVQADESHLTNVIYNLLDNAYKYGGQEKSITVSIICSNEIVNINVKDNGEGIPTKDINKVFDKFYRVPRKDSDTIKGFGLGLYYVKKVCKEHHWKIKLDSRTGKGTNIQLSMPKI